MKSFLMRLAPVLLWIAVLQGAFCQIPRGWTRFSSTTAGYSAYYPETWHAHQESMLEIATFLPSERVRVVILPANGALINISRPPRGVTSIKDWVKYDSGVTGVQSGRRITLRSTDNKKLLQVTEVISKPIEVQQAVYCYFNVDGEIFAAHLVYWNGDSNADTHRRVLYGVLGSVELTH